MKKKLIKASIIIFLIIFFGNHYYKKNYAEKKSISVMLWYGILDEKTIKEFETQYNVTVNIKYFFSNEELISKLNINNDNIDLIFPSDYAVYTLMKQKLIQPINPKKIIHFKNLSPKLLENITYNKKCFGIPYAWSAYGIVVNDALYNDIGKNTNIVDWYKIFFTGMHNNKKYKIGGITDMLTIINVAYHYYKQNFKKNKIYSRSNLFNIIQEIVKAQHQNTIVYLNCEYLDQLLVHKMIDITLMQSADFIRIMQEHPGLPFKFLLPEYYNLRVCEYLALTKTANNVDLCYQFINFLLEKDQIEAMVKKNFWFHPRKDIVINDFPLFTQISIETDKKKKFYYTEKIFTAEELLALIMNLKT